jgi:hypothetical protein
LARDYFDRYPKDRYETVVESWREIQSFNIEFVMKRLREPVEKAGVNSRERPRREPRIGVNQNIRQPIFNYLSTSSGDEKAKHHLFLAVSRVQHYRRALLARPDAQPVELYHFVRGDGHRCHDHYRRLVRC